MEEKNEEIVFPLFEKLYDRHKSGLYTTDKSGVKTVEEIDANLKGFNAQQRQIVFPGRKTPLEYVSKELAWYDTKSLSIHDGVSDVKVWRDVADKNGMVNSNYGWCIYSDENFNQFESTVRELERNPASRRATMIYNRPSMQVEFNKNGMSDFICTYSTQHFIRDNKLTYVVNQRSCDMIYGFFNDLAWHQEVQRRLHTRLQSSNPSLEIGPINMNLGSAHVYERHLKMLERIVEEYKK